MALKIVHTYLKIKIARCKILCGVISHIKIKLFLFLRVYVLHRSTAAYISLLRMAILGSEI